MTRGLAQATSSMAGQPQGQQGAHTKHHAYVFPLLNNKDILTPSGLALLSGANASFSLVLLVLSLLTIDPMPVGDRPLFEADS